VQIIQDAGENKLEQNQVRRWCGQCVTRAASPSGRRRARRRGCPRTWSRPPASRRPAGTRWPPVAASPPSGSETRPAVAPAACPERPPAARGRWPPARHQRRHYRRAAAHVSCPERPPAARGHWAPARRHRRRATASGDPWITIRMVLGVARS
jgi:hypothetical protein